MALATLAQIRAGLNTRLATITGVQTSAYPSAVPALPFVYVVGNDQTEYLGAMQGGLVPWQIIVHALVSNAPPTPENAAHLDEFISPTGSKSVKAAIEGSGPSQTLSGIVSDVVVMRVSRPTIFETEQQSYYGAEFSVSVYATP